MIYQIKTRVTCSSRALMLGILSTVAALCMTQSSTAHDAGARFHDANERYRAGDLDGVLQHLNALLEASDVDQPTRERARELAVRTLHERGEERFRAGQIAEAVADFDREILLQPRRAAHHWQRGIAYYYAGEFEKGARQFELHQTVNPQDVENAAWHFLCMARTTNESVEAARKNLIPVTDDSRVPMAQIQKMFAGILPPDDVLRSGEEAGGAAQFYADLYVGLYYEALGRGAESLRLIQRAANNTAADGNYMRDVARVHVAQRTKSTTATTARRQIAAAATRRILFLAGSPSHGYGAHDHLAGCRLLAKSLNDSGLPIEAKVHHYGWPDDPGAFEDIDCIVIYGDGGAGHMVHGHIDELQAMIDKGIGLVCLHYAVEVPKGPVGEKFLQWIGGYFEANWSVNPHWTARFADLPEHSITRGVKPFEINDEWYYHMRFREQMRGVTPILSDLPPPETLARPDGSHSGNSHVRAAMARQEVQHVAWCVERDDGGRGFGFTGAHVHWNWADPNFRKLVLNAIAWCAKVDVPAEGVSDAPKTLADMESNHDEDTPANFDREAIRRKYDLPPDKPDP